jgi:energy-coupling factor transporter ATP-binding protein EcfA2
MTRLTPFRTRLADRLSGGMKQKLALACTLVHQPELVVLDEPTTGVDPVSRREFWKLLSEFLARGVTIVMSTPYLDEAERCTRVALMHEGQVLAADQPGRLRALLSGGMVEVVASGAAAALDAVRALPGVADAQAFGDRLHVRLNAADAATVDAFAGSLRSDLLPDARVRTVEASLEDVFIATLEQKERAELRGKLKELNAAFQSPQLIGVGYYQASLVVNHIVERFGHDALRRLVAVHAKGMDDEAGLKAALNVDFDDLQATFDKAMEARFGALRAALKPPGGDAELLKMPVDALKALAEKNPDSFPVHMVLGTNLRRYNDPDGALKAFERAAELVPMATGDDNPHQQIAEIALERKDLPRAIAALEALMKHDFDNVDVARELVKVLRDAKITDPARLQPVYERITAVDPYDGEAHAALGRLAMQRSDWDTAVKAFQVCYSDLPLTGAGLASKRDVRGLGDPALGSRIEGRPLLVSDHERAHASARTHLLIQEVQGGQYGVAAGRLHEDERHGSTAVIRLGARDLSVRAHHVHKVVRILFNAEELPVTETRVNRDTGNDDRNLVRIVDLESRAHGSPLT